MGGKERDEDFHLMQGIFLKGNVLVFCKLEMNTS